MRSTVDCAVLMVPAHTRWVDAWMDSHQDRLGRVRFWRVALDGEPGGRADPGQDLPLPQVLSRLTPGMRRYDACLLPVAPPTLGWTRMALAGAQRAWPVPLLALARDLKAAALQDLLALGLDDFMRDTACVDEIAARLGQRRRQAPSPAATRWPAAACPASLAESPAAYAQVPRASRACGPFSPGISGEPGAPAGAGAGSELPFRIAKSRVVVAFERQYIHDALARASGNIAVASRAARKHRRAFWALMRKHKIDAAPYREAAQSGQAKLP